MGFEMMEVEAGAAIYRNKIAQGRHEEGTPYARPPAPPTGGGGNPHPPWGVGAGTDGLRAEPRQLARADGGPMSPIADQGQKGLTEATINSEK